MIFSFVVGDTAEHSATKYNMIVASLEHTKN